MNIWIWIFYPRSTKWWYPYTLFPSSESFAQGIRCSSAIAQRSGRNRCCPQLQWQAFWGCCCQERSGHHPLVNVDRKLRNIAIVNGKTQRLLWPSSIVKLMLACQGGPTEVFFPWMLSYASKTGISLRQIDTFDFDENMNLMWAQFQW